MLYIGKGCTSKKISKTNTILDEKYTKIEIKIDSLSNVIRKLENKSIDSKEATNIMERVMLDYLIYEDDLDKRKTSLSEIKNKIEMND